MFIEEIDVLKFNDWSTVSTVSVVPSFCISADRETI